MSQFFRELNWSHKFSKTKLISHNSFKEQFKILLENSTAQKISKYIRKTHKRRIPEMIDIDKNEKLLRT